MSEPEINFYMRLILEQLSRVQDSYFLRQIWTILKRHVEKNSNN